MDRMKDKFVVVTGAAHGIGAAIARRFQLRLVPGHPVAALPSITLRPKHGMMMSLAKM